MLRTAILLILIFQTLSLRSQDTEYAREVINVLASREFKGRGYAGNGHAIAAQYIARQFNHIGLESFSKNRNKSALNFTRFFQTFHIQVNSFPSRMKLNIDSKELRAGEEFLVHPASPSVRGNYSLLVIQKKDLANTDSFNKIINNSSGKFIVIDERGYDSGDKERNEKIRKSSDIIKKEDQIASAGTIILTESKLTWSVSTARENKPVITVNCNNIRRPSEAGVNIVSDYASYITKNIVGYVPGSVYPDSFIVLIAHYDHLGMMGKKVYFPGANDNASGVAMVLSLARYFKMNPLPYSVVFIAMAAEETGLDGARYFVDNPLFDLRKIRFLINFDLAGTGDEGIKVVNATLYKDQFDLLKKINGQKNYLKDIQPRTPACNSDHCMFHERGVPCFYIYTLGGITAYHDIYDRSETLPLTEFNDYMKLITEFLELLN